MYACIHACKYGMSMCSRVWYACMHSHHDCLNGQMYNHRYKYMYVCTCADMHTHPQAYAHAYLHRSIHMNVCLSVKEIRSIIPCPSVCLPVCLSEFPHNRMEFTVDSLSVSFYACVHGRIHTQNCNQGQTSIHAWNERHTRIHTQNCNQCQTGLFLNSEPE